jgi:hypothetical protein
MWGDRNVEAYIVVQHVRNIMSMTLSNIATQIWNNLP